MCELTIIVTSIIKISVVNNVHKITMEHFQAGHCYGAENRCVVCVLCLGFM
jgi:hypothetical protein